MKIRIFLVGALAAFQMAAARPSHANGADAELAMVRDYGVKKLLSIGKSAPKAAAEGTAFSLASAGGIWYLTRRFISME